MERKIVTTTDGSSSLYVPKLNEHYHSMHGAETESRHIFIDAGFRNTDKETVSVLEFGLGTGLNAILTLKAAEEKKCCVVYHAVEKYPLDRQEILQLRFNATADPLYEGYLRDIHFSGWTKEVNITNTFSMRKFRMDFRDFRAEDTYDVIYFDAFAPDVQPALWSEEIFRELFRAMQPGGLLTTYSSKGSVRRTLAGAGFRVEKLPGPPGKREFLCAIRD